MFIQDKFDIKDHFEKAKVWAILTDSLADSGVACCFITGIFGDVIQVKTLSGVDYYDVPSDNIFSTRIEADRALETRLNK